MSDIQATPRLSLFQIEAELLQLIDARQDCMERCTAADAAEDTVTSEECDEELQTITTLIRDYVSREIQKVDGIAKAVKEYTARAKARKQAAEEMAASAARDSETVDRIKEMVLEVMQQFGEKKLPGRLFTITRQGNGGQQALTISQPDLVPDAFKRVLVSMPLMYWDALVEQRPGLTHSATVKAVEPNREAIRNQLEHGEGVMGCKLEDRGEHIRIE